jgi:hypothetical protein
MRKNPKELNWKCGCRSEKSRVVGIMQPYYFPYLGYFSHIVESDLFVFHDDVKYTKKGWINRNKIWSRDKEIPLSLPLRKAPDSLPISGRFISQDYQSERQFRIIEGAYRSFAHWDELQEVVTPLLDVENDNLSAYLTRGLNALCQTLEIKSEIKNSSEILGLDGTVSQERVLTICQNLEASIYLNPKGGEHLYDPEAFLERGIALHFIEWSGDVAMKSELKPDETEGPEPPNARLSILDSFARSGIQETKSAIRSNYTIYCSLS